MSTLAESLRSPPTTRQRDTEPSLFFGKDWTPKLKDYLRQQSESWCADINPLHYTYEDLAHPFEMDVLPTNLQLKFEGLYAVVPKKDRIRMHFETKYLRKAGPRNVRLATLVLRAFNNIAWEWSSASGLSATDVLGFMDTIHLHPTKRGLWDGSFSPPKAQASLGLYWSRDMGVSWGRKSDEQGGIWSFAMTEAALDMDGLINEGLRWSRDCTPEQGRRLALKYHWVFMPAFRLDGGPHKLRLLLIGTVCMYIIEKWVWHYLAESMVRHENFGYRPQGVLKWVESLRPGQACLSGDFVSYDLHQTPEHLRAVYEAVSILCDLPESLMVALYLYNAYAPLVCVSALGSLVVRWRNGQAPSGIGGFSYANTIGCGAVNYKVARVFMRKYFEPGNYMGDDHIQPIGVGVARWRRAMQDECALLLDSSDALVSGQHMKYQRRFLSHGEYGSHPIVMSRARNAVFPEDQGVESTHPLLRALRGRAQTHEIITTRWDSQSAAIRTAWYNLCPPRYLLYDKYPAEWDMTRILQDEQHSNSLSKVTSELCEATIAKFKRNLAWYTGQDWI